MATGMAAAEANTTLDAFIAAYPWIQLHTADPGAAGLVATAGNTTRKNTVAAFTPAAAGTATSDVDVSWTDAEVNTAETYTHFSLWTASTAGTFGGSGTVSANTVAVSGDSFAILAGGLTLGLTVAA